MHVHVIWQHFYILSYLIQEIKYRVEEKTACQSK